MHVQRDRFRENRTDMIIIVVLVNIRRKLKIPYGNTSIQQPNFLDRGSVPRFKIL